jgi:hypothetical protein
VTELLEKALAEVSKLSGDEQDRIARFLLLELEDEASWDRSFASSQDLLAGLADEALAEHSAGRSREIGDELEIPRD